MKVTAECPLQWPDGWERSRLSGFDLSGGAQRWNVVLNRIGHRAELMGLKNVVISTNQPVRQDGMPYSARHRIDDPAVAIYFTRKDQQLVMAQDKFAKIEDNMRSVAIALEAIARMDRHGGGKMLDRAFTGFVAITDRSDFRAVLKIDPGDDLREAERSFKKLAMLAHPDHGGSESAMAELNTAMDAARASLT